MHATQKPDLKPIGPWLKGQVVGYVEPERKFCTIGGEWFALSVVPQQEKLAKADLADAGFVPYLPMMPCRERHGRGSQRTMQRPILGPYMFVRCEATAAAWQKVATTRGVHRLLGDDRPRTVSEGQIEVIRLYEAKKFQEEIDRARCEEAAAIAKAGGRSGIVWHFTAGDEVRIKNGPFAGFLAKLETAVDVHDRIRALISLFGRPSVSEISAFDIEAL